MAVYTEVSDDAVVALLAEYDIGSAVAFRGIAEGVENSNFSLRTTRGDYILTLYEKRVDPAELPWFLGLMEHLAGQGIDCPLPVRGRDGASLRALCRAERRDHHLPPRRLAASRAPGALRATRRSIGARSTWRARATHRFGPTRSGRQAGRRCLIVSGRARTSCSPALRPSSMPRSPMSWPAGRATLPGGHIHADLFPDNVFFLEGRVSGIIDFYFACNRPPGL